MMTAVLHRPGRIGAERQENAPAMPDRPASPIPQNQPRRERSLSGLAWQQLRRAPATIGYLAAVWVAGLATGSIAHGPPRWLSGHVGAGLPSLGHGYWWTPLSAGLWASGLGSYLAVTVLGLLILAPAEQRMGVTRTFTTLLACQAAGFLLAAGLIKLAGLAGEPWLSALTGETAVGAPPGLLGVGFALSCTLTPLWRRRLRLLLTVAVTVSVMYIGHLEQVAQACGAVAGLVTMALTYDRARPWAGLRASQREVRVLVGTLVAVPALGGMLAAGAVDPDGPMSLFSLLSVQAAPAFLLLMSAYGLRRGRRLAWWLAVVINLTVLAVSIWVTYAVGSDPRAHIAGLDAGARAIVLTGEEMLLPAATLIVLLVTRRRFDQTADLAYYDADAADRARAILTRGGSTLSYMSTWPGNQYWFSPDGRAAIAYRAIAGVAVTVGGPYGDPAALDSAITEFARFCEHRGLQPCLYSVTAQARAVTQQLGWKSVQIAEDTLLPLARLHFTGKKWQDVRTALNKAARDGITAEWWSYPQAPPELAGQIHQISQKWIADKGLPEMGFTLGGLDELNDPHIRCLIAVDADRTVHGITSWMPVYASGRPAGWTLDFMRRNTEPGAFRGVMEFLIATAALTFQEEGARFVSLSGAPLARLDRGEQPSTLQRLLDKIANTMEPVYGFQSLLHFKAKFQPAYQPLYLAYPDPAALGSIAAAIGRAYLPHLTSRQAVRLLTKLLGWPHTSRGPVQQGERRRIRFVTTRWSPAG
jgi:lysylphosphatidylglycerol synthetase-like protein (DUF2156 family)